ncbi:hypothetical protein GSI_12234 [Ganoderma sinense ZZ0214-1]|uniref:BTB domain-containing protein n=1 Tax=Ganoderma sinense ZZ0214-1 TaxID=1077348 RepID=A0A2G8RY83_9APHY|nr:hypothetical protein GSI_12234 [Ganoderma sinense ZZ0214-1]
MSPDRQETRPLKRSRTQAAQDDLSGSQPSSKMETTLGDFERSEEFWLEDGSIILVAQQTGFRVYRALLARQSTVFSNMFSSSTPNAEEMVEGCPVVYMSESAEEVAHLLHVLLPTSQRTLFSRNFSFSFEQISAIIRLAHKYDIQDVLDQAIASLAHFFTSDFDTWERNKKQVVDVTLAQSICIVNLARLVDWPSLLPVALYQCALLGSTVLGGYKHDNASVEHLHPDDLRRVIRGRNRLAKEANEMVAEIFISDPCARCTTRASCRDALRRMLEIAVADDGCSSPEVLRSWDCGIENWGEEEGLCDACQRAAVERDTTARRHVWNKLPDIIFGLGVDGQVADIEANDVISETA